MTYVQPGNAPGPNATQQPWQPNDDLSGPQVLLRVADLSRELVAADRTPQAAVHVPQAPAVSPAPLASLRQLPARPTERPVTPPVTAPPTSATTAPQTTITASVLPSALKIDTTVTAEVQPSAPTLALLAGQLTNTTDAPAAKIATVATVAAATTVAAEADATASAAPAIAVTVPAQHRPLPFLSSFLLSSRRRQLMTFSLAVMALLVLFRAPNNRSADPKTENESTTQRDNPPRRVAEGSGDVGPSEWETGIPATPGADHRGASGSTSPAGWTPSDHGTAVPSAPIDKSHPTSDWSASEDSEIPQAPQVDLTGMEYPATDPATFQYPANAHDLIISMLARDSAGH